MSKDTKHICQYCQAETTQPDEQCYANPKNRTSKQSSVEWFAEITAKLGYVSANILEQAKEMEKEQMMDAIKNELKLIGNYFDVSKLEQREQGHHIRFTSILKDRFDFYNETYGGNK
jgi:hypothetical protein